MTTVEIDEAMAEVAQKWFGFQPDSKLSVKITDGLEFISQSAHEGNE